MVAKCKKTQWSKAIETKKYHTQKEECEEWRTVIIDSVYCKTYPTKCTGIWCASAKVGCLVQHGTHTGITVLFVEDEIL